MAKNSAIKITDSFEAFKILRKTFVTKTRDARKRNPNIDSKLLAIWDTIVLSAIGNKMPQALVSYYKLIDKKSEIRTCLKLLEDYGFIDIEKIDNNADEDYWKTLDGLSVWINDIDISDDYSRYKIDWKNLK